MLYRKVTDVLLKQELHSENQRREGKGKGAITLLILRCRDIKCPIILAIKQVCFCIFFKYSYSLHVLLAVDWISGYKIKVHFQNFLNVHLPIYVFFDKLLRSFNIPCHYPQTLKMLLRYMHSSSPNPNKKAKKCCSTICYMFLQNWVGFRSGHSHGNRTHILLCGYHTLGVRGGRTNPPRMRQMSEIKRNSISYSEDVERSPPEHLPSKKTVLNHKFKINVTDIVEFNNILAYSNFCWKEWFLAFFEFSKSKPKQ